MGGVQSHFIVKPNLVLRLGWGFDNKSLFYFWEACVELGQAQLKLELKLSFTWFKICCIMMKQKYYWLLWPLKIPTTNNKQPELGYSNAPLHSNMLACFLAKKFRSLWSILPSSASTQLNSTQTTAEVVFISIWSSNPTTHPHPPTHPQEKFYPSMHDSF